MNPMLLALGCLLLTQTAAVWVLVAAAWQQPFPGWLFPVTGRWRVYLVRGYLTITTLGPAVAAAAIPDSPPSRGVVIPNTFLVIPWILMDGLWLGFSAVIVTVIYAMLDLTGEPAVTASKGKSFLPRNNDRPHL